MKKFDYLGAAVADYRNRTATGKNKPLRTLQEMADEFGVTLNQLSSRIQHKEGPPPEIKHKGATGKKSYYDPDILRRWWRDVGASA